MQREFFGPYQELLAELDAAIASLTRLHRLRLRCAPGCSHCCQEFSLLPLEAAMVQRALARLSPVEQKAVAAKARSGSNRCPLLAEERCRLYPARPLICRSHGMPIGYIDRQREVIEVSACPRNFPEDYPFSHQELLFMDPFNARLAALNGRFVQSGIATTDRLSMRDIVLGR